MTVKYVEFIEDIFSHLFVFDRPSKIRPYFPSRREEKNSGYDVRLRNNNLAVVFFQFKVPKYLAYTDNTNIRKNTDFYRFKDSITNDLILYNRGFFSPLYKMQLYKHPVEKFKQHNLLKSLAQLPGMNVFYASPAFTTYKQMYDIYYDDSTTIEQNSFIINVNDMPFIGKTRPMLNEDEAHCVIYAEDSNNDYYGRVYSKKSLVIENYTKPIFKEPVDDIEESLDNVFNKLREVVQKDEIVKKKLTKEQEIFIYSNNELKEKKMIEISQHIFKKYYNIDMILYHI